MTNLIPVLMVIASSIIGAFGGFIFKKTSSNLSLNIIRLIKNYNLIFGFILFGISSVIYITALKYEALNVLYPISALTYVWSTLIAKRFLGEKINIYKWGGITLILIGAALIVQ